MRNRLRYGKGVGIIRLDSMQEHMDNVSRERLNSKIESKGSASNQTHQKRNDAFKWDHQYNREYKGKKKSRNLKTCQQKLTGLPGWFSSLVPPFGPGHDPGVPGSSPMSGSLPAWSLLLLLPVSLPLSLCVCLS